MGLIDGAREAYQFRGQPTDRKQSPPGEPGLDDEIFSAPMNSDWEEAWRVTEGLIVQMRSEVNAKACRDFTLNDKIKFIGSCFDLRERP